MGIGTDNPSWGLDLQRNANTQARFIRNDAGDSFLRVNSHTGNIVGLQLGDNTDVDKQMIRADNTNNALIFNTANSEKLRITSSGNVGIGTDNPNATLHVEKDGTSENLARFEANTGTYTNRAITIISPETDDPNAPFTFLTGNSFQFQCDTHIGIKIDDDGLVGIGTAIPATALSVAGDVRVQNSSNASQYLTINYQGIDFQNTGAGSSTTSSAHLLDDYEEGTFTPTITDATSYSTQKGYYTKVGRLVHFTIRVQPNAGTGSASALEIAGLPFTSASISSGPYGGAFSVYDDLVDRNSIPNLNWFIGTNSNVIQALSSSSNIATNNSAVNLTGNYLYVGSYYTA